MPVSSLDALVHGPDRVDREPARRGGRRDDVAPQHQVLHVGGRDQHALLAGQSRAPADVEEALDLLVHAADRLHLAVLVHRAGDRSAAGSARRRARRAARTARPSEALSPSTRAVGLLEHQARRERQRLVARRSAPRGTPTGSSRPWSGSAPPSSTSRSMSITSPSPRRVVAVMRVGPAEGEVAELDHRQAVDLPDARAGGVDQHRAAQDRLLHARSRRRPARRSCASMAPCTSRRPRSRARPRRAGPVVGLAQQVGAARSTCGDELARRRRPARAPCSMTRATRAAVERAAACSRARASPIKRAYSAGRRRARVDASSKSAATLNSSRELRVVGRAAGSRACALADQHHLQRRAGSARARATRVLTRPSAWPSDSMRISRARSARLAPPRRTAASAPCSASSTR